LVLVVVDADADADDDEVVEEGIEEDDAE